MRVILTALIISFGILSWHGAIAAGLVDAGEVVYKKHCIECHGTGFKGAPMVGDKAAWADRIKKSDLLLIDHVFYGHKKMPIFGDCSECNIQDFANAVAYMVSVSE